MTYLSAEDTARAAEIFAGIPLGRQTALMEIVDEVSDATGVPVHMILSNDMRREITQARQLAYFVAHTHGFSLPEIGKAMNRDHTTVLSGIRAERKRRSANA